MSTKTSTSSSAEVVASSSAQAVTAAPPAEVSPRAPCLADSATTLTGVGSSALSITASSDQGGGAGGYRSDEGGTGMSGKESGSAGSGFVLDEDGCWVRMDGLEQQYQTVDSTEQPNRRSFVIKMEPTAPEPDAQELRAAVAALKLPPVPPSTSRRRVIPASAQLSCAAPAPKAALPEASLSQIPPYSSAQSQLLSKPTNASASSRPQLTATPEVGTQQTQPKPSPAAHTTSLRSRKAIDRSSAAKKCRAPLANPAAAARSRNTRVRPTSDPSQSPRAEQPLDTVGVVGSVAVTGNVVGDVTSGGELEEEWL